MDGKTMTTELKVPEASAETNMDVDEILNMLRHGFEKFPKAAIQQARLRREEIIPHLLQAMTEASAAFAAGNSPADDLAFFAIYLLTEFQERRTWPILRELISHPGKACDEYFGDSVSEDFNNLFAFYVESPDELDAIFSNPQIYCSIRWAAIRAYPYLVKDGRLTREAATQRLCQLLRRELDTHTDQPQQHAHDEYMTNIDILVCELADYATPEIMDDIREAFHRGLVDTGLVNERSFQDVLASGDGYWNRAQQSLKPCSIPDTIAHMEWWHCFQPQKPPRKSSADDSDDSPEFASKRGASQQSLLDEDPFDSPVDTIRYDEPHVGRNDPCPCGSGKKFKKCCAKSS